MRLIDADAFNVIGLDAKSEEFIKGAEYILGMIDRQPTAYDVKKVVEELKKHSYIVRVARMNGTDNTKILNPAKAIEIVRKGGVE